MGLAQTLRSLDIVAAWREWPSANQAYLSRGLTIGAPISKKSDVSSDAFSKETGKIVQAIQVLIRCGGDEEAIRRLTALCTQSDSRVPEAVLNDLRNRRAGFAAMEEVLPTLIGSRGRIPIYRQWLEELPAFDVRPFLSGLASEGVAVPHTINPLVRIPQCRAMQTWTTLFDSTNGFQAPVDEIADEMEKESQSTSVSRAYAISHFPPLIQAVRKFAVVADHQAALTELLQVMESQSKSGLWPKWVEDKVVVQKGEVEVSLRVSPG